MWTSFHMRISKTSYIVPFDWHVQIVEKLKDKTISINMFSQHELHPKSSDSSAVDWLFVVDTLNFCFWSPDELHYSVSYKGKKYTGYFALCAALNRAQVIRLIIMYCSLSNFKTGLLSWLMFSPFPSLQDYGKPITDPKFYSQLTSKELSEILQGDEGSAALALMNERTECLRQVGLCLLEKFDG